VSARSSRGKPGNPQDVAVYRFLAAPSQPGGTPDLPPATQQTTTVTSTSAPSQSAPRTLLTCLSRRSFSIRVRPRHRHLVSAVVKVAGKKVSVRKVGGRLVATVDLRKLKQATFTVSIVAKDSKGRTYRDRRSYRTCRVGKNGPKVKGGSTVITLGA
jgi:hypothetical protein